jgi:site-specific DNA-cytosine methylase
MKEIDSEYPVVDKNKESISTRLVKQFYKKRKRTVTETTMKTFKTFLIEADGKTVYNFYKEKIDVIVGGPPCQGFSTANPSRSFDDPRNQLFKQYSRIIKNVKPKLFLMENVSGMVTMEKGKVFKLIN